MLFRPSRWLVCGCLIALSLVACREERQPYQWPQADTTLDATPDVVADAGPDGTPDAEPELPPEVVDATIDPGPPDVEPDLPDAPLTVSMATFNVWRYFDTVCDTGDCGWNSYEEQPSFSEFQAKGAEIAGGITELGTDIVVLQEVESQACIDELLDHVGADYPVAVLGETNGPASLDVAVLASGELLEVRTHRNIFIKHPISGTTQFTREFLEVHLDMGGWRVVVFAAHFKSKADDDPMRRLAEAMAAHDIVADTAAEFPDALVVMGGDLNDTPGSAPLQALVEDGVLLRAASDLPEGSDWTYTYNGNPIAIDHLLVATTARGDYVSKTAEVVREGFGGLGGSDHAGLRAEFHLEPPPP